MFLFVQETEPVLYYLVGSQIAVENSQVMMTLKTLVKKRVGGQVIAEVSPIHWNGGTNCVWFYWSERKMCPCCCWISASPLTSKRLRRGNHWISAAPFSIKLVLPSLSWLSLLEVPATVSSDRAGSSPRNSLLPSCEIRSGSLSSTTTIGTGPA